MACPHAAPLPPDWVADLVRLAALTPQPEALADLLRPIRRHEQFRLAVCACPNGCVRPQVADLGLVAARSVRVDAAACVGCNVCAETCPDAAITLRHGGTLYSIGIGRSHNRKPVTAVIHGLNITISDATTGEILRHLTLDPTHRYQPQKRQQGEP